MYKLLVGIEHQVSVIESACEDTDWAEVGANRARLLARIVSMIGDHCLKPFKSDIYDMHCFSCEKHKKKAYLDLAIPSTLKMISWLNEALKELATENALSIRRAKLIHQIEVIDSALVAEFACLSEFIKDCVKTKSKELDLAILARR